MADISDAIIAEYSAFPVACGPDLADRAWFPYVRMGLFKDFPWIPHIVPKETFNPKVAVAFRFDHTYVQSSENLESSRLISDKMLRTYTEKIFRFVLAYLENLNVGEDKTFFKYNITQGGGIGSVLNSIESQITFLNRAVNYFVTDINITRARKEIGNATITLKDNRNLNGPAAQNVFYEGATSLFHQLFVPMLPVTVWARGRFYDDYFFPIFDGFITSISYDTSEGFSSLEIQCRDVLELARISVEMVDPALIQVAEDRKIDNINLYSKPFYGHDHLELVKRLFVGGPIQYDPYGETTKEEIIQFYGEDTEGAPVLTRTQQLINFSKLSQSGLVISEGGTADLDPSKIKGALNLMRLERFEYHDVYKAGFDVAYKDTMESKVLHKDDFTLEEIVRRVDRNVNRKVFAWGAKLTPYRIWGIQGTKLFVSDFASRLDVLQEISGNVYFDFYVDGAGHFHYHPYRIANKFLNYETSYLLGETPAYNPRVFPGANVVGPEELTNEVSMVNSEEMVTFLKLVGQDPETNIEAVLGNIYGSAVDREHLSRFGYRRKLEENALFNVNFSLAPYTKDDLQIALATGGLISSLGFQHSANDIVISNLQKAISSITFGDLMAVALIRWMNAELYTKEATIIFRPELEIASPIYFTADDSVFYVNSITHSISIGGSATTTVNASFGRKRYETPVDLYSFLEQTERAYKNRDKTGIDAKSFIKSLNLVDYIKYLTDRQFSNLLENYVRAQTELDKSSSSLDENEDSEDFEVDLT